MILDAIRSIGSTFSSEEYLFWTHVQGSMWTLADIVIVFYLIRIANLFRAYLDRRIHRGAYVVLAATIPFALFLPLTKTGTDFFYLELAVTVPHFLILLYVCIGDASITLEAIGKRVREMKATGQAESSVP
jgi:hypothetical protein